MRESSTRLAAAFGFLSALAMAASAAHAQLPPIGIPGIPGTPSCPPNSSCAPGTPPATPNPPGTCGPGPGGATCGGAGPAAINLGWAGANRNDDYVYNPLDGKNNRNSYLCDKQGNALDQRKYAGTLLPTCHQPSP